MVDANDRLNRLLPAITLDEEKAGALWEIISDTCGASESMREMFMLYAVGRPETGGQGEFRFMGKLGFGGKLYIPTFGRPYVSYYQEDYTEERAKVQAEANDLIILLYESWS